MRHVMMKAEAEGEVLGGVLPLPPEQRGGVQQPPSSTSPAGAAQLEWEKWVTQPDNPDKRTQVVRTSGLLRPPHASSPAWVWANLS